MADKLNNPSHFLRFTIPPPALLDSSVLQLGPYLFNGGGMQDQYPHYSPSPVIPLQFMPHASPSTSTGTSSSENSQNYENSQPGSVNRNHCPAQLVRCEDTISIKILKVMRLCNLNLLS